MGKIMDNYKNAVLDKNGKLENFLISIAGKNFKCSCGCNCFHKPDKNNKYIYECNACGILYEGEGVK